MPMLIGLALIGAGVYAGYRWFARATEEIAAEMRRTDEEMLRRASGKPIEKDLGALEYDPARGVYRPANRQ
jgi:hypothetical protein